MDTMCFASRLAEKNQQHTGMNELNKIKKQKVAGLIIYPIKFSVRLLFGMTHVRNFIAYMCVCSGAFARAIASNMTCAYFEDGILNLCEVNL